jgi:hypothetical protein
MNKIYTPAHIRFLGKKFTGRSCKEVTRLFNERFGMSVAPMAIKTLLARYGLRNNHGRGVPREKKYLPHHIRFLKGIVRGRGYAEITGLFNAQFGFAISVTAMGAILAKHNLKNGRDCRIKPGNVPFSKGKKGYCPPGSEKGWFKPGQEGTNTRPVGSERVSRDGYLEVKITDKKCRDARTRQRRWKHKHVVIWEKVNGPVPPGHVVVFLDGDRSHIVLNNLMLLSRQEHAVMCHMHWYTNDREVTRANCLMARIKVAAANLKRKTFKAVKNKKMVFLNEKGCKVYVIQDKNRWIPVRETSAGGRRRLRVKRLKPRSSRGEAQRDLYAYAAYRGWMRI